MRYIEESKKIEQQIQKFWEEKNIYQAKIDHTKLKKVILDFFPYPSGIGLHVGHPLGYIATDIYARFKRLQGYNVLYAMGFDSFGLPAEQFSIETGKHPEIITKENIANMKKQLKRLGLAHDQSRSFSTTDIDYYKWTQFIFLKLYNSYFDLKENKAKPISVLEAALKKKGLSEDEVQLELTKNRLAYLDEIEVNWCPKLGTVLADEEVINGLSERGNHPVFRKPLKQWILRITAYSKRLLQNLDDLFWPDSVKEMQKNWIGLSSGFEIKFPADESSLSLTVFTTRPETLSGATFCAISVKHPKILEFAKTKQAQNFIKQDDIINGVFSGSFVLNPVTNKKIPVYIADYVLPYGCAAVMGVPAHDTRDNNFAKAHNLPIIWVIKPDQEFLDEHNLDLTTLQNINSAPAYEKKNILLNGRKIEEEIEYLKKTIGMQEKEHTKLRDWIFSRQRYWGEPFPIIFDSRGIPYALEESALPVVLPHLENFQVENDFEFNKEADKKIDKEVDIKKPLDKALEWKKVNIVKLDLHTVCVVDAFPGDNIIIDGKTYTVETGMRETNTMPNWAGSCWYYLRYMDPQNNKEFVSNEAEKYWGLSQENKIGSLDLYLGGAEHAVLHLLYARFWHMVLFDLGLVSAPEPFYRLFNQGMITGTAYQDSSNRYIDPKDVELKNGLAFIKGTNQELKILQGKLGKRYKNGVPPEEVCNLYSADTFRLHMMYLGPLEQNKPWNYDAIKGMARLLEKVYALSEKIDTSEPSKELLFSLNETIKKITHDCENLRFNTAIACFIILINSLKTCPAEIWPKILIIFSVFAPHLCEYLFQKIHPGTSIFQQKWPEFMEMTPQNFEIVITVNGKKKGVITLDSYCGDLEFDKLIDNFAKDNGVSFNKKIIVKNDKNFPKLVNFI